MQERQSGSRGAWQGAMWSWRLLWSALIALVLLLRALFPPRDLDASGPIALRDGALSLAHWLIFLLVAGSVGLWLVRRLSPPGSSDLETLLYAAALGLGLMAYLVLGLGLTGLLYPVSLQLTTLVIGLLTAPYARELLGRLSSLAQGLRGWLDSGSAIRRISALVTGLIALLALVHTLGPAWDYDGLMYHLPGPAYFLANHRILPNLDNWYVNGPFTVELLFTYGLAYGDVVFAKLIHYSFGWVYVAAAVAVAQRWLGPRQAWFSAVILLGMPTLPIWASFAYVDLGWASFEFLALAAGLMWWQTRSDRWLVLAGVLTGLAVGSKYPGLMGCAAMCGLVAALSAGHGLGRLVRNLSLFLGVALALAAPWYAKNWLWFGNPVYPLYLGGPGWDAERLRLYQAYLGTFGAGRSLLDWLLLPWNIYARHEQFGAVMNRIDVPSLLFPLLLLYPLRRGPRAINLLLAFAAARSMLWAFGSQQTRFLLPAFPAMAVATTHMLNRLFPRSVGRLPWHILFPALAVALSGITLYYQVVVVAQYAPHLPAVGWESTRHFLRRIVRDFPAVEFASSVLPASARALQLGDGRAYYCQERCVPDPDHFRWAVQINRRTSVGELASWLQAEGYTHLLLSWEDIDFLLQHDPASTMLSAVLRLKEWMTTPCFRVVFADEWSTLAEVSCY